MAFHFLFFLLPFLELSTACLSSGVCGGCAPAPAPSCTPASCSPGYSCGSYGCARNRARSSLTKKIDGIFLEDDRLLKERPIAEEKQLVKEEERKEANRRNVFGIERNKIKGVSGSKEFQTGAGGRKDGERGDSGSKELARRSGKEDEVELREATSRWQPPANIDNQTLALLKNPNYIFRQCCEERRLPDACLNKCNFNAYTKDALQGMYLRADSCPLAAAADMQFCAAQGRDHRGCCARNGVTTTLAGEKCLTFCDQTPDRITKLDYSYVPCYDKFENMKRCFYDEIKRSAERQFSLA